MFERKHIILALFLAVITVVSGIHFLTTANHEFIIYIGIIIAAFCLIAATFPKVRYPFSCLVGLVIWALLHLAGGAIRINNDVLYAFIVLPLSSNYPLLRYDQLVHAWGFGTSTLIMLHLLARITSTQNLRRFSTGLLAITAGMGLGAFNENIEFILTVLLPQTGVGGYINTSLDLCSNFVGAVIAYLLFYFGVIRLENYTNSLVLLDMSTQEISARALSLFHEKPKRFNCAQTIAAAFDREDLIEPLKSCGGGRAPGGLCGALYAATLLVGDEKSEAIKEQFQQTIGHRECKLIKQTSKATCSDCVQCAAKLVEAVEK